MDTLTIYIDLRDEDTHVWRPVDAESVADDIYRIVSLNEHPDDETWQFQTGDLVRCVRKDMTDGISGLVAIERVESAI